MQTDIAAGFTLPARKYEELRFSVASMRLDNIVRCVAGTSRTGAVEKYITPQLVTLNGTVCTDVSKAAKRGRCVPSEEKASSYCSVSVKQAEKVIYILLLKNIFRVHLGGLSREC